MVQDKLMKWIEGGFTTVLGDVAVFADSLYPVFVITCMLGIYLRMFGAKEKGSKLSSISFLGYLLIKVMANAYGK